MNKPNTKWTPCTYRLSAKGIIVIDSELLMVIEGDDDGWDLPGGGVEHGETVSEGFSREILEETSLRVVDMAASPAILHIIQSSSPEKPHGLWAAYRCVTGGEPTATEGVVFKMVSKEEFSSVALFSRIESLRGKISSAAWPD